MALLEEGSTDNRFLSSIAQRTASRILNLKSKSVVDVPEPQIVSSRDKGSQEDRILWAAQDSHGYHLLLVHADADACSGEDALAERIEPGFKKTREAHETGVQVCDKKVPVIPIRMTESWMLADLEALFNVIGTSVSPRDISLPNSPSQVESITHPKRKLQEVLNFAVGGSSRRRRKTRDVGRLYEPLARGIDLERLSGVPAFRKFQKDLTQVLYELHFI